MAVANIITDYTGRQRDLLINLGLDPKSSKTQPVSLGFGPMSSACAGIQKLVQRYMVLLMTGLGTQPAFPSAGSEFASSLLPGRNFSRTGLTHDFNFANADILRLMQAEQSLTRRPPDEQISSAYLSSVDVVGDRVSLNIRVVSYAGENVDFLLPLAI